MNNILKYFPEDIKIILQEELNVINDDNVLEEIRIRVLKPIILKFSNYEKIIKYRVSKEEIFNIFQNICENSIYSYQEQIKNGFVTIESGIRVGISGSCNMENEKVKTINYINSLNFRISHEIYGASNTIINYIINGESIYNTLIVSPPGCGKTTILRDIVRRLSSGIKEIKFKGINISLIDERGEIAALYKGIPQNDIGIKTDVLDNVSKSIGIRMMVRSMSPKVIVCDEIGNLNDIDAINFAMSSGCKGIFSSHGSNFQDLYINPFFSKLMDLNIFEIIAILDDKNVGVLKEIYRLNKNDLKYEKIY